MLKETVSIKSKTCPMCGESGEVEVPAQGVPAYVQGALIQNAFPDLAVELREQLISGIHPKCWEEMFADLEEEEDEF